MRVNIGAKELDDHKVLTAGILDQDTLVCSIMGHQEFVHGRVPALDLEASIEAFPLPDKDIVNALFDGEITCSWLNHELFSIELGRVIEDPKLPGSGLLT